MKFKRNYDRFLDVYILRIGDFDMELVGAAGGLIVYIGPEVEDRVEYDLESRTLEIDMGTDTHGNQLLFMEHSHGKLWLKER